jgi:hypothetical protein
VKDDPGSATLLNEMLLILADLMRFRPETQKEAVKIRLFRVIAGLLSETFTLKLNSQTFTILRELMRSIEVEKLTEEVSSSFIISQRSASFSWICSGIGSSLQERRMK